MNPNSTPRPIALPGLLVTPLWLEDHLGTPGLRLVDLRDPESFAGGHIPGATNLQLAELGTGIGGLENTLLGPDEFSTLMAGQGISDGDAVIAYDDQWGLAAARLVWALHRYGHDNAAVLDGGWDRWQDEGGPSETGAEPVKPGTFEAAPRADVYADADWIAEHIRSGEATLLDTRSPAEFDRGHLPGAHCWDWFNAVPPGSWDVARDPEELRAEWRNLGLEPSGEVTVYCRSGMRAAHTWLVLRAAGFERVRLYDGSWQEWSMKNPEKSDD